MIIRDIEGVDCPTTLSCGDIVTSTKWNNLQDTLDFMHKQGRTVVSESGNTDTDSGSESFKPLLGVRGASGISGSPSLTEMSYGFPMPPGYRRILLMFDVALMFGFGVGSTATGIWEDIKFEIVGTGGATTIAHLFPIRSPFITDNGIIITGGADHRSPLTSFTELEIPRSLLPNANTTNELYLRMTRTTQFQILNTVYGFPTINWSGVGYVTLKIFKGFDR